MVDSAQTSPTTWNRTLSATRTGISVLLPLLVVAAPILTGTYYLVLASGSATAARQMMLVTDPINTALALTVAFFPVLLAAAALASVLLSRGRFSTLSAYWLVLLAVLVSGTNMDTLLWVVLVILASVTVVLSLAVPGEYPQQIFEFARDRSERPRFRGRVARWIARHRRLEKVTVAGSIGAFAASVMIVFALFAGLVVDQFLRPPLYEVTFDGNVEPTTVVWFSIADTGTWYVTEHSARDVDPDAAIGARDLEWVPSAPTSVVACGLSATACGAARGGE